MTWNFAILAADQIINSAAKMLQMSGGQYNCPIVFRGGNGTAGQLGATHSQSFEAFYSHVPGLKVITTANHITSLPKSFHINIPVALSDEITANPSRAREIGIEWSSMQAKELLAHNVCGLHYYIMANPSPSVKVIESLGL